MFPAKAFFRTRKSHLQAGPCRRGSGGGIISERRATSRNPQALGPRRAAAMPTPVANAYCCRTAINLLSTVLI
jgi:hypothetical protein